jgi:hypothetical protein
VVLALQTNSSRVALDALTKTDAKYHFNSVAAIAINLMQASCISIGHPSKDALKGVAD